MSNFLFVRIDSDQDLISQNISWLRLSSTGKVEQLAESDTISSALTHIDSNSQLVLIIPDKWVSFYVAEIPIKESKKQLQAIPYILEDKILTDVSNMHFSIGSALGKNLYIVAAIAKDRIVNLIDLFAKSFQLQPATILTDAMCLYNNTEKSVDDYKIYLNGVTNSALILNHHITVTDLNNLPLIINQLGVRLNADIFRFQIDDINNCFKNSLSKININSDQNIDKWLPLIAQAWMHNPQKAKFNLAKSLVKQNHFNIKFAKPWRYTAVITVLAAVIFFAYNFLDESIYLARDQEINSIISNEFAKVGIENSNITLATKQIVKSIQDYEREIIAELKKDKFYLLLSRFSENFTRDIVIKKIIFKDNNLELTMTMATSNPKLLERIKAKVNTNNIIVKEQPAENPEEIVWVLSLDEKISLNI